MPKLIPQLGVRLRGGSNGKPTVERDYLEFTRLTHYDCETEPEAREKIRAEIDDYINQLIIMRACL